MRASKAFVGLLCLCLGLSSVSSQEQPLINYASLFGEFDYDYYRGNPSVGLVRDGIAEGFTVAIPPDFTPVVDEEDKVSGLASQRLSFNRNASSVAEARFSMRMDFPSEDYPRPGETIRISLWVKAENWNNASFSVRAYDLNGGNTVILIDTPNPPSAWTRLEFQYTVPNVNPLGIWVDIRVRSNAGASSGVIRLDKLEVTGSKRWRPHQPRSLKLTAPYYSWAPESQRDWVYYAREFDAIQAPWDEIKRLRTHRPDLLNIFYYSLIYSTRTVSSTGWAERDLIGYWYADTRHPDWFLLNIFNNRQQFGSYLFLMDIGNPAVSNWAAQNLALSTYYIDSGVDAIHFDSFIDFFFTSFLLQKYPTPASRMAAMHKHLRNMRAVLQERDVKFIINAAGNAYTRDQPHTYFLRQGLLDGMLMEQAFTHIFLFPPGYLPFYIWESQLNTLIENRPRLRVVYSGYGVSDPVEGRRQKIYALASFLLCADDNIYLYLDKHYYDGTPIDRQRSWRPDADFDVPLGQPVGNVQVFFRSSDYRGGLYYRQFQNGFVLVNPTGDIRPRFKDGAVFTWVLDADYWELRSGQVYPAGTRIKLYPKDGLIFVRASSAALRDYPPAKGKLGVPSPRLDTTPSLPLDTTHTGPKPIRK